MMEKDLHKFYNNLHLKTKDLSYYEDKNGNYFYFNTVNALVRVDKLELTKEEFESAKFGLKVDDLKYNIKNIKRPVPKNEITGKEEDKTTIVEKEVAVREIWNLSNAFGIHKSFIDKESALKEAKDINEMIEKVL